ncbi:MAG: hypothetical protein LBR73_01330 [Oscillospiraceae bacterium]|jgi:hypothetical protein|nr:hypothetical protein [Oscillospiraceae bacterium]
MESTTLRLTKARLYFIDHFEGEERAHLIAMLEKYQADGIFPEIAENAMHMAFGAVAKSIDSAKKRAATKAAKLAAQNAAGDAQETGRQESTAAAPPVVAKAAANAAAPARTNLPTVKPLKKSAEELERERRFNDFWLFYQRFPFKNNKLSPHRAYEMWNDFAMDAQPIEVVLKALNRDIGRGKFNKHAPTLHQWLCWESWAA